MTDQRTQFGACQNQEVAAYLDGELDQHARSVFEEHLKQCRPCAAQLDEQKRLLNALDFALGDGEGSRLPLPKDFTEVITARAESDMSGVRRRSEHGLALRACAVLALVAFALLGGAALSESVIQPAYALARHVASIADVMGRVLYDAGAGMAVISRNVGGHLLFEAHPLILVSSFLLALALALLLLRLINGLQRTRASS